MNAKEWIAALHKSGRPGPLLATLREGKQADVAARLKALDGYAEDPAVGDALLELVGTPPWTSDSSKPLWNLVFELASKTKDPRLKEATPTWDVRPLMKRWLSNGWKRAVAGLPERAELSAARREALDAHAGAAKPVSTRNTSEDELLAAIYANPADDTPRQVYADMLLEKGDPRGEFISLQLANADEKKQRALLKAHGKQWLGELAEVLASTYEFRRGFLSKATIKFRNKADFDKWSDRPEWATVEEVDFAGRGTVPEGQAGFIYAITPAMKSLKKASRVMREAIVDTSAPWALEVLGVELTENGLVALFESDRFPRLHTLESHKKVTPALFERLRRVGAVKHFIGHSALPAETVAAASKHPFETVTMNGLVYRRGPDGALHNADAPAAAPRATALPETGFIIELAARPDDTLTVIGSTALHHVDASGTRLLRQTPRRYWYNDCTGFDEKGRFVVIGYRNVKVTDPATGEALLEARAPATEPYSSNLLSFSPDGRFISGVRSAVYDLEKNVEVKPPRGVGKACFVDPEQRWWLVFERFDDVTDPVLLRHDSKERRRLTGAGPAKKIVLSSRGVLFTQSEANLSSWDVATGRRIASADGLRLLSFCCRGAVLTAGGGDAIHALDAQTLQVLRSWPGARCATISDDRKTAWVLTQQDGATPGITREAFDR